MCYNIIAITHHVEVTVHLLQFSLSIVALVSLRSPICGLKQSDLNKISHSAFFDINGGCLKSRAKRVMDTTGSLRYTSSPLHLAVTYFETFLNRLSWNSFYSSFFFLRKSSDSFVGLQSRDRLRHLRNALLAMILFCEPE